MFGFLKKIFGTAQDRMVKKYFKIVAHINAHEKQLQGLSDEALKAKTQEFRERLQKGETLDQLLPEAYAVIKNACRRLVGTPVHVSGYDQNWDMVPFDVQLVGATALHYGSIVEMHTGEGKTLTAVLPLYLNALTGKPVHLVTTNDYLAHRDCQWTGSVLRWLGLTTGSLTNDTPMHERKSIYLCDVVYGTASEFGFDYLRDNSMVQRKDQQVQRGYYYSIIDEADSILIDEARTPLIISGPSAVSRQMYDELKGGVAELVKSQREMCNRLANEARKILEKPEDAQGQPAKKDKKQEEAEDEACRKLWLVSKGTPTNKILKRLKEDPDIRATLDKRDIYFHAEQNKAERAEALSELFIIVDERANDYELTDKGMQAWQHHNGGQGDDFTLLDISHEYLKIDADDTLDAEAKMARKLAVQQEDAVRKERAHNLRQLLRGHLLMERDVDYIVQDDKIIIIDENTGRPQPGRRFSDGLHQAIEAKEGVAIQKETQTYATITLQNYFRMYEKLAGMTGTASTEAGEFKQIYKMDVLSIPTNKTCIRTDSNDEVYMTEREKYTAILKEIREVHEKGRPILIGTESVEISEKLSRILRQHKLEHTVLNAKQHDKEAEVIAQAGRLGAITIATNMAGRGTDIKLDQDIASKGGLHVIGTTRHQSRRIDRQLRGRCARQGDPGSSKFYISFEDSLMRLFASPRLTGILQKFRPPEGEPISASILNRSIETAQKRVEQRHSTIRKHTLEYDDVMNKQRQEIYAFRNEILSAHQLEPLALEIIEGVCESGSEKFFRSRSEEAGWDPEGYRQWLLHLFPISFEENAFDDEYLEAHELAKLAVDKISVAFHDKLQRENQKVAGSANANNESGKASLATPVNETLRNIMLRKTDQLWQEHLLVMDHLRSDVALRALGQRDPLLEFKHEAFALFDEFGRTLRQDIVHDLFRFEIVTREQMEMQQLLARLQLETQRSFVLEPGEQAAISQEQRPTPLQPVAVGIRTGRNELCPCGSGKKYKRCCGYSQSDEE